MKKYFVLFISLIMVFTVASITCGYNQTTIDSLRFDGFGARADAMGGAFTAVANDGSAIYWNPAGITQIKILAVTLDGADISDAEFYSYDQNILFGITTKYIGIGVFAKMCDGSTSDDSITKHFVRADYVLTLAAPLVGNYISVGCNIKNITSFIDSDAVGINAQGTAWAYDLGLLAKPTDTINIGFVIRDLNAPIIKTNDFTTGNITFMKVYKNYSMGLSYKPFKSTTLASDLELLNDDLKLHLGVEQTALWEFISLRAGMIQSLTNVNTPTKINLGVGVKLFGLYVDGTLLGIENNNYTGFEVAMGFRY